MDANECVCRWCSGPDPQGALVYATGFVFTRQEICIYFFFFVCFLNNKRILMPHIDYTFLCKPKGELQKVC